MTLLSDQLDSDGYFVIPGLLDKSDVDFYRGKLSQLAGDRARFDSARTAYPGWTVADGVSTRPDFWPLIYNDRLLSAMRNALSGDGRVVFTQHSDLHVNEGVVGWHRDCANRQFGVGPDWDESQSKYRVVRVAIYLQLFAESGFKLGLMPRSHRMSHWLFDFQCKAFARMRTWVTDKRNILPPIVLGKKPVWIEVNPGDCVVFDTRLLHSGSPVHGPKYAVYLSYGVNNEHALRHRNYYFQERPELGYREMPKELQHRLQEKGLLLDQVGQ